MPATMIPNLISFELSAEDRAAILAAIAILKEKMPFLVGLDPKARRKLLKVGDSGRAFIKKAFEVAHMVPDYVPKALNMEEMRKDMALIEDLYPIMVALSQVTEKMSDSYAIAGSEAYGSALVIYRNCKDAKGPEGLEAALADLGRLFARRETAASEGEDKSEGESKGTGERKSTGERKKK